MSMIGWVLDISATQAAALRTAPTLAGDLANVAQVDTFSGPDVGDLCVQVAEARRRLAFLAPFHGALELGKSWHILHYLFTGHAWDASAPGDALLTGEELGGDLGYGPARLHDAEETREFARFLQTTEVTQLQERVSYPDMIRNDVYGLPGGGHGSAAEFENEIRSEVAAYLPRLKQYVAAAAAVRHGLLVWLS